MIGNNTEEIAEEIAEEIVEENNKNDDESKDISWRKWLLIMGIATVILVAVFFTAVYFMFVYSSKKVVKETADIYLNGEGSDITEIQCPDYVAFFQENYSYSDIDSTNQNYIDAFRQEACSKVGELVSIDVDIDGIYTISNLEELKDDFAQYGVVDIEKYKQVNMIWDISGEDGDISISATAFVMKYSGKWYLDYISFSW